MNTPHHIPGPLLGLKSGELSRTSLSGLVAAVCREDRSEIARYRELSDFTGRITNQSQTAAHHFHVPADLLLPRDMATPQTRDMTVAGVSGSQYMVGTQNVGFADPLRKRSILGRLPVQRYTELRSNATISREVSTHTTTWLGSESSVISDGQSTLGQVAMAPKTLAATIKASRQLMLQGGPSAEAFLSNTLAGAAAEGGDAAFITGSGSLGEPLGLHNTPGIDTRTGSSFDLQDAADMLKVCDGYQMADTIAWVAGVDTASLLRQREKAAGNGFILDGDQILGKPVLVSRSAAAASLTVAQFGDVHFAQWGALEIGIDPFTHFRTGVVLVRVIWMVDFSAATPAQVAVATAVS